MYKANIYVKPRDGKMLVYRGKNSNGEAINESFDRVSGIVKEISIRESEWNGEQIKSWNIKIVDGEETYILTLGYSNGFTRGFFNSLISADLSKPIKFGCYVKNEYNCPSLIQNEGIVRWKYGVDQMPKTEKVKIGTKEVIDDTKAVEWMLKVVDEIQANIKNFEAVEIFGGEEVKKTEEFKSEESDILPF